MRLSFLPGDQNEALIDEIKDKKMAPRQEDQSPGHSSSSARSWGASSLKQARPAVSFATECVGRVIVDSLSKARYAFVKYLKAFNAMGFVVLGPHGPGGSDTLAGVPGE
jgi:hypothetical protein